MRKMNGKYQRIYTVMLGAMLLVPLLSVSSIQPLRLELKEAYAQSTSLDIIKEIDVTAT